MNIRTVALATAGALLASALAITPAGAQTSHREAAVTGPAGAMQAWWVKVEPGYTTLEQDVKGVAHSVETYNTAGLAGVNAACQKVATDSQDLLKQPAAPNKKIDTQWQTGLFFYQQGGTLCARASTSKTEKIRQGAHDLGKGRVKLAAAVAQIRKLVGTST